MRIRKFVPSIALLAAAAAVGTAGAAAPVTIGLGHKAPFGGYLTDGAGRALYMFTADQGGTSHCYGACAAAWPPLITAGKPAAAAGVPASRLGVTIRSDKARQVTYDGMPLYYFRADTAAGTTAGEEINHFGGEWYLVSAEGKKIEKD
jgi:predicted lipoprotein with Yx(FWY)xxD motif